MNAAVTIAVIVLALIAISALSVALLRARRHSRQAPSWPSAPDDAAVPDYMPTEYDVSTTRERAGRGRPTVRPKGERFILERIEVQNFKSIDLLRVDLAGASELPGEWNCIAGINGSGKTSILQAACLLLLGPSDAAQVGNKRLAGMVGGLLSDGRSEIHGTIRRGREKFGLSLRLGPEGIDKLYQRDYYSRMREVPDLQAQLLASYGANRSLSEYRDTRYFDISDRARKQMTLFDPLTQISGVDVLLDGGPPDTVNLLCRLIHAVLGENIGAHPPTDRSKISFRQGSAHVEATSLPDGFRSIVAWLADLCVGWQELGMVSRQTDPRQLTGIVLIDEIDLHLHPTLQRSLVPALRKALPQVQFIVTTHSPMVLASFDRAELVLLDRDSENGIRRLDRQIFGMTMDDVYAWLMNTDPSSQAIEELIEQGTHPDVAAYLYQSRDVGEDEAKRILAEQKAIIQRLREG